MFLPEPPDLLPVLRVYGDSSSHDAGHEYMVLGCLCLRDSNYEGITSDITAIKEAHGLKGEMKWSKYKGGGKRPAYFALVELCFDLLRKRRADLHCIAAQFGKFQHRAFGSGSKAVSVNKMYYQLVIHRLCRQYGRDFRIHLYPDDGDDSAELSRFRDKICAEAYKRYQTRPNCLPVVESTNSASESILQMADVVIGGIAALKNNRRLKEDKADLAHHIRKESGFDWQANTPAYKHKMTFWNFRHQGSPPP